MPLSTPLNMVQLHPDPAALLRFLAGQGQHHAADSDLGYGVHAWLAATFGVLAPRPFRLHLDAGHRKPPKLLAYSPHGREALLDQARTFAEPAARAVCPLDEGLAVAALPGPEHWQPGRRLGFEILACPVTRRARTGVERDCFLREADRAGPDAGLDRAAVYCDWLAARIEEAAAVETCDLAAFHLVQQFRQGHQAGRHGRGRAHLVRPAALLRGVLRIVDGAAFHGQLARGVGRHGAFGYGMLLVRPL
ncbi:type I-E CRISPR-associated protein Cas6/Cse3/CasE [uncultured Lamprocystis sp.]|jgi:CRISPR system Cascade subunit CasE|uniref:type I-E CRISPR-associated protein Cas6/Cse3/CasE n=1 Tax=uncultured Lamprocystis sp. TaxID=543132 RepID=UPI0025D3F235|nr:type I-E CRISPR-associated protein Cas6/Cse3/CasE [uncultured Lamprocystis sp.]